MNAVCCVLMPGLVQGMGLVRWGLVQGTGLVLGLSSVGGVSMTGLISGDGFSARTCFRVLI